MIKKYTVTYSPEIKWYWVSMISTTQQIAYFENMEDPVLILFKNCPSNPITLIPSLVQ